MIYFQVEDINRLFKELSDLESNAWIPKPLATTTTTAVDENRKPAARKRTGKKTASANPPKKPTRRTAPNPALKAMMTAGRKELEKEAAPVSSSGSLLDARTPSSVLKPVNKSVEKLFEGGFFSVRSPVHRSASPSVRQRAATEVKGEGATAARLDFDEET